MKRIVVYLICLGAIFLGISYYLLLRPFENIDVSNQITFNEIEPKNIHKYPVIVKDLMHLDLVTLIEKDVKITMSDGVKLSANVFRPKGGDKYPVVLSFTAYDKDKGPDAYPPPLKASYLDHFNLGKFEVSPWTMWEAPDPAFWVSHGYAVVQVDSRGYFKSEGSASLFDDQNIQDFHETITWAGTQDWSNGNVGLNGVSYLAISQWVAASKNPPSHLKAIIPWEGNTDGYREVLYHGGIPETVFTSFWVNRIRECANKNIPLPPFYLFKLGHKNPKLLKIIKDPPSIDLQSITVPALICATWSDQGLHSRGSFEGYKQIKSKDKWMFTHGRQKWDVYYSQESLQYQKRFFDYFLKEANNGMDSLKSVRLEVREDLENYHVRYEDSWPIPNTDYHKLYLNPIAKKLQTDAILTESSITYDAMKGQANFRFNFKEETELSGNMKLKLWISTNKGSDMDLFVALKKYDTLGKEVSFYAKAGYQKGPVAMGWLRVSERELDTIKSSPWQPVLTHNNPKKISKNEIIPVEIEILPSSTLFRKGEVLELVIQGRDIFKHPAMGHHYSVNKGKHSIYAGDNYDSHLLVPRIPRENKRVK